MPESLDQLIAELGSREWAVIRVPSSPAAYGVQDLRLGHLVWCGQQVAQVKAACRQAAGPPVTPKPLAKVVVFGRFFGRS